MYIRIWNKRINDNALAIPAIYDVRPDVKIEDNVENIEIPRYNDNNTYLVFGYIITKRRFSRKLGIVKPEHYICTFTNNFTHAYCLLDTFVCANRKYMDKYVSVLRIYEFSKDSTDILYTDFHNGTRIFADEYNSTINDSKLKEISLKYADYFKGIYNYNVNSHSIVYNPKLSGYVYHNSEVFTEGDLLEHRQLNGNHAWLNWYKHEYMVNNNND